MRTEARLAKPNIPGSSCAIYASTCSGGIMIAPPNNIFVELMMDRLSIRVQLEIMHRSIILLMVHPGLIQQDIDDVAVYPSGADGQYSPVGKPAHPANRFSCPVGH